MKKTRKTFISVLIIISILLISTVSCTKIIKNKKNQEIVEPINISKGIIEGSTATSPERKAAVTSAVIGSVAVVEARTRTGISSGSGFLIDKELGYVVTNAHVVVDNEYYNTVSKNIVVKFLNKAYLDNKSPKTEYISLKAEADVSLIDPIADVALLKINQTEILQQMQDLKFADAKDVKYGQEAIFIGNPEAIGISVGQAIVANPNYIITYQTNLSFFGSEIRKVPYIQIDGNINHGNSGGPLFDLNGSVMGIVSLRREADLSKAAPIVQGVGFVLRSDQVINSIIKMLNKKGINRTADFYFA